MGGKLEMKLSRIKNQESFGLEQEIETRNFFNYPPSKEEEEITFRRSSLMMEYG